MRGPFGGRKELFTGPVLQFALNVWLSPVGAVDSHGDLKFKENVYICFAHSWPS